MAAPLLDRLEAFQGEIGRRILKLSKFHSLLSTRLALRWPSVAARIFIQKLNLLFKINSEEDSIGCHIFSKLAAKDPQSLRIIQECRYLEDRVECHGATDNIIIQGRKLMGGGWNGFSANRPSRGVWGDASPHKI